VNPGFDSTPSSSTLTYPINKREFLQRTSSDKRDAFGSMESGLVWCDADRFEAGIQCQPADIAHGLHVASPITSDCVLCSVGDLLVVPSHGNLSQVATGGRKIDGECAYFVVFRR
jgi:hypothetical protein